MAVCAWATSSGTLTQRYRNAAGRLIGAALVDDDGWSKLTYLCDRIGHRLTGSPQLEDAIEWAAGTMESEGVRVTRQPVQAPHWVRGSESARLISPRPAPLAMLGLGMSVGTPPEGITAEVVAVSDFEELEALGADQVSGKIVLYDVPFTNYRETVQYRSHGASRAAALGAAAVLIRSVGPVSLQHRRTIRVVLWTNEENGLTGGRAYREWVGDDVAAHVAAIEMDGGSERPLGFGLSVAGDDPAVQRALRRAREIGRLLEGIDAGEMRLGGGGPDIGPLMRDGVPGFGLRTVGEHYFHWHHTHADTLDKISPHDFRLNVAALAVLAYVLADMPERLAE